MRNIIPIIAGFLISFIRAQSEETQNYRLLDSEEIAFLSINFAIHFLGMVGQAFLIYVWSIKGISGDWDKFTIVIIFIDFFKGLNLMIIGLSISIPSFIILAGGGFKYLQTAGCDIMGVSIIVSYGLYLIALVPYVLSRYYAFIHGTILNFRKSMICFFLAAFICSIFAIMPIFFGVHYETSSGGSHCSVPWRNPSILNFPTTFFAISSILLCSVLTFVTYYRYDIILKN
jgi:hypothetical protein